jgi:8-oxo-dGTP diphosphatase
MSYRAGVVLIQDRKVALIERHRSGLHYFTFPGGHIETGETPEQAALREVKEELGLQVSLKQLLFRYGWQGSWQYYYLAEATGGTFGSGAGEEMHVSSAKHGIYRPTWMAVRDLLDNPVKPRELAELVVRWMQEGWPTEPVILPEQPRSGVGG